MYINSDSACGSGGAVGTNRECTSEEMKYITAVVDYMGEFISEEDLKINAKNCWVISSFGGYYPTLWFEKYIY